MRKGQTHEILLLIAGLKMVCLWIPAGSLRVCVWENKPLGLFFLHFEKTTRLLNVLNQYKCYSVMFSLKK